MRVVGNSAWTTDDIELSAYTTQPLKPLLSEQLCTPPAPFSETVSQYSPIARPPFDSDEEVLTSAANEIVDGDRGGSDTDGDGTSSSAEGESDSETEEEEKGDETRLVIDEPPKEQHIFTELRKETGNLVRQMAFMGKKLLLKHEIDKARSYYEELKKDLIQITNWAHNVRDYIVEYANRKVAPHVLLNQTEILLVERMCDEETKETRQIQALALRHSGTVFKVDMDVPRPITVPKIWLNTAKEINLREEKLKVDFDITIEAYPRPIRPRLGEYTHGEHGRHVVKRQNSLMLCADTLKLRASLVMKRVGDILEDMVSLNKDFKKYSDYEMLLNIGSNPEPPSNQKEAPVGTRAGGAAACEEKEEEPVRCTCGAFENLGRNLANFNKAVGANFNEMLVSNAPKVGLGTDEGYCTGDSSCSKRKLDSLLPGPPTKRHRKCRYRD